MSETRLCNVCGHARWHEHAQAQLNPVALILFMETLPCSPAVAARTIQYIKSVTGLTEDVLKQARDEAHESSRERRR